MISLHLCIGMRQWDTHSPHAVAAAVGVDSYYHSVDLCCHGHRADDRNSFVNLDATIELDDVEWLNYNKPMIHSPFVECLLTNEWHFYRTFAARKHFVRNQLGTMILMWGKKPKSLMKTIFFAFIETKEWTSFTVTTYPWMVATENVPHPPKRLYGTDRLWSPHPADYRIDRVALEHMSTSSIWNGTISHRRKSMDWSSPMATAHRMHRLPSMPFQRLAWTMWPNKRHASVHLEAIPYTKRVNAMWRFNDKIWERYLNTNHKILCKINIVDIGWECGCQECIKFETAENSPIRTCDNVAQYASQYLWNVGGGGEH